MSSPDKNLPTPENPSSSNPAGKKATSSQPKGTTRRTFLLRSSGALAGLALGSEYLAPNLTSLAIPSAFASASPLPQYSHVSALLDLAGHWKLNEESGSVAGDSSGNDNHGALIGSPSWHAGTLNFPAPASAVRIPAGAEINNLDSFSVALWFYADSTGEQGKGRFISKANSFSLRFSNRQSMIYFVADRWIGNRGKWRVRTENGETLLGGWHHLAVTYKYSSPSRRPKFYLDGQPLSRVDTLSTPSGAVDDDPTPIYLGNRRTFNRTFDGRLSDVRLYPHVLKAHEIAHLVTGS